MELFEWGRVSGMNRMEWTRQHRTNGVKQTEQSGLSEVDDNKCGDGILSGIG